MISTLLAVPLVLLAAEGLIAEWRDGTRTVTAVVPTPSFSLLADESVHPAVGPKFSATYTGALKVLVPGKYRFHAAPATLTIRGQPVGDAPVALGPGLHPIQIRYQRPAGPARLQLRWESEGFGAEPIPAAAFHHDQAPAAAAPWMAADRGRALVDDLGCQGCHGTAPLARTAHGRGPDLSNIGKRTTAAWIYRWLEDPTAYRAAARMPHVPLSETERRDLTAFLASTQLPIYGDMLEAEEPLLDEARTAQEAAKGKDLIEQIGCLACHGTGPGMIDAQAVGSKMSFSALRSFLLDPGRVEPTGRMPNMGLSPEEATAIAAALSLRRKPELEVPPPPGDRGKGRALFAERGCAGCHELSIEGTPLASVLKAPALTATAARARRGCLAPEPPGRAPRYRLTDAQRAEIAAHLAAPDVARSPAADLRHAVEYHRCRHCHELEGPALVTLAEKPPSLADTGNKLTPSWVRAVLGERVRARSWLPLRMPRFPTAAKVAAEGFADLAGAPRDDPPAPPAPDPLVVRAGVRSLGSGEGGLACVNCHDHGAFRPGSATPAPDMATMGRRIRPEWFRRWMLDPQRIQPGTQMPTYFAEGDRSMAEERIEAMLAALSLGSKMPLPDGVKVEDRAVKLPVRDGPVVFRTFLAGGPTRAIAVGFPGGLSYAFDAHDCRLALAWQGEFLDVRPVWMERGGQEAIALGERWFTAPEGSPLRLNDPGRAPTVRFRGYELARGVPVFRYELDGAQVRERIEPAGDGRRLVRSIEVRGRGVRELWYVPGTAPGVAISAEGAARDAEGRFHARGRGAITLRLTVSPAPLAGPAP